MKPAVKRGSSSSESCGGSPIFLPAVLDEEGQKERQARYTEPRSPRRVSSGVVGDRSASRQAADRREEEAPLLLLLFPSLDYGCSTVQVCVSEPPKLTLMQRPE